MGIDWQHEDWTRIKNVYAQWWNSELDRPLFNLSTSGRDPGRPEPNLPSKAFYSFYDIDIPAVDIVGRLDDGCFVANPEFVNQDNGDYRLAPGSAARTILH